MGSLTIILWCTVYKRNVNCEHHRGKRRKLDNFWNKEHWKCPSILAKTRINKQAGNWFYVKESNSLVSKRKEVSMLAFLNWRTKIPLKTSSSYLARSIQAWPKKAWHLRAFPQKYVIRSERWRHEQKILEFSLTETHWKQTKSATPRRIDCCDEKLATF